jgi:hypothetical protein
MSEMGAATASQVTTSARANTRSIGILLISVAVGAVGQLTLKAAVSSGGKLTLSLQTLVGMATNPLLILAIGLYLIRDQCCILASGIAPGRS